MRRTRRFLDGVEAEEAEKERLEMLRRAAMGGTGAGGQGEDEGEGRGGDGAGCVNLAFGLFSVDRAISLRSVQEADGV